MKAWTITAMSAVLSLSSLTQANLITNGTFDTDVSGWTYLPFVNNSWGGTQWFNDAGGMALIWGSGHEGGYLYQDNGSHPFAAGETYTVSFDLINEGNGQPDIEVNLIDTTLNQVAATKYVLANQFETTRVNFSFNYVVEASRIGNNWRLDVDPVHWGSYTGIDNVSVTAVPEPSTALLLSTVLFGSIVRRKRK